MLRDLDLGNGRQAPASAMELRFSRAGGPGGQHVNRTETKVDLRLDLAALEAVLGAAALGRIRQKLGTRIDGEGRLQVVCAETRSRQRNAEIALERMEQLVRRAAAKPRPRRKTKPTRGSQERRLQEKKRRGEIKRQRRNED